MVNVDSYHIHRNSAYDLIIASDLERESQRQLGINYYIYNSLSRRDAPARQICKQGSIKKVVNYRR